MGFRQLALSLSATLGGILLAVAPLIRGTELGSHLRTQHATHFSIHAVSFAMLTTMVLILANSRRTKALLLLSVVLLAAGGEYMEHIFGRFPFEVADFLIDLIGVATGVVVLSLRQDYPKHQRVNSIPPLNEELLR